MSPLVRLVTCDAVLVRRSRLGDRSATRRLATRHLERITFLASVIGSNPEQSTALAQRGFALALRDGRPFADALVRAFDGLADTVEDADAARTRLAGLLVEVEQRPADEVARLLRLDPDQLAHLGSPHAARACRGWPLASRRPGLTRAEVQAGVGHLELCRRCRDRLAAVDRTRVKLLGGSAGVVGAAAATQLGPWGGAAAGGAGALVSGKAAAGLIGVVGAAVLATGGTAVVVDRTQPHAPAARPAPAVGTPAGATPSKSASTPAPSTAPSPEPTRSAVPLPTNLPTNLPTSLPATVPSQPAVPLPLPTLPLPLPLPLPNVPVLPLPDPLPSVLASLLDLP